MDSIQMMEKVAEHAPSIFAFLTSPGVRSTIANSPFRDEVLGEFDFIMKTAQEKLEHCLPGAFMNKEAFGAAGPVGASGLGSFAMHAAARGLNALGRELPGKAMALGGAIAGGVALALAGDMYHAAKRGLTKTKHYENMLAHHKDLGEFPAQRVHSLFSTLHRMAPHLAEDPLVAGSFVRQQAQLADSNGVELGTLTNLINANRMVGEQSGLPRFGGGK